MISCTLAHDLRPHVPYKQPWLYVPAHNLKFTAAVAVNDQAYILSIQFSELQTIGNNHLPLSSWINLTHLISPSHFTVGSEVVRFAESLHLYDRPEYEHVCSYGDPESFITNEEMLADQLGMFDERDMHSRQRETERARHITQIIRTVLKTA